MEIEKAILRRVGEAIGKYRMIRDGDRVAVGLSGGKDSVTLLHALLKLRDRAPVRFSVEAFTVDQGKFLAPVQPVGEYFRSLGVSWTYIQDTPSLRLLDQQPHHGCDLCSRFRRRAVYDLARRLGANVIALGHTADDFCEALLRNALFIGRLSALPPVAFSRRREFRLIRPLVFVTEEFTARYAASLSVPVVPCGCSQKTGTVRRSLRDLLDELARDYPHVKESLLAAMQHVDLPRLLDPRYSDPALENAAPPPTVALPVVTES